MRQQADGRPDRPRGVVERMDAVLSGRMDDLAHLLTDALDVPIALVTLIDRAGGRQVFIGQHGLPEPWASRGETPLSHSFCRHVIDADAPLVLRDARLDPEHCVNLAVRDLGVIAYLGVPVRDLDGRPVAVICAIDTCPRDWTAADLRTVSTVGGCVGDRLVLADALSESETAHARTEAALHAKTRFLAQMSHEIRTPLNGVIGLADELSSELEGDLRRGLADAIRDAGDTLLAVVNDVLDIGRIEAGKLVLAEAPLAPAELAERARSLHQCVAVARGIDLEVRVAPGAAQRRGDLNRLMQIVNNLLNNALKFSEGGAVALAVESPPDGPLAIEVADTGIGIEEDRIADMFAPYEQADHEVVRRSGGTGLGLAIVSSLVGAMNGRIAVASAPGRGTRIRVSLPLPVEAGESAQAPDPVPIATLRGVRVLAADDNRTNRMLLERMLERLGAEVTVVADGLAAVAAAGERRFDLLLLDVLMPGLDGIGALAEIRREETARGLPPVPAIAVTANALAEQAEAHIAAGFDGHLSKPLRIGRFAGCCAAILDTGRSARS